MKNPAEIASEETLQKVFEALDNNTPFKVEAGAGAGKTYSLIEALKYLIDKRSRELNSSNQRIACITYTNVAKDEIIDRTYNNPIVFTETIHAFAWSIIQKFQRQMRNFIPTISEKWAKRIEEVGGIIKQNVQYDLGYPSADEKTIKLHHDDVIKIIAHFLSMPKFVKLLKSQYPIILIDEYQDTAKVLAESLVNNVIEKEYNFLIGFFGDHWQTIYGSKSCGAIQGSEGKLVEIGKNVNFRSDRLLVETFNRIRPELPQNEYDPKSNGEVLVFHSNLWTGERRTDNHWQGDLPIEFAKEFFEKTKSELIDKKWDLKKTKILMLTNNLLAEEQGYINLAKFFSDTDDYIKKNNPYIRFLIDTVEVVSRNFINKRYGEMFNSIGVTTPKLNNHSEKSRWNKDLNKLQALRESSTIGEVIKHLQKTQRPRLSSKIEEIEQYYVEQEKLLEKKDVDADEDFVNWLNELKSISYQELIQLDKYIDDKTPFSTQHGVKGAEFENVLVVCGRGWNNYNWNYFLEWEGNGFPDSKRGSYERNRNLFYVSITRAKKRLAVLFTQKLSDSSILTLEEIFLKENVHSIQI